jgi:hypothetical protein
MISRIMLLVIDWLIQFSSRGTAHNFCILVDVTNLKNLCKSSVFSEFL